MTADGTWPGFTAEPAQTADHRSWMEYAVGQGMDEGQARGLTRDQIRARFASPAVARVLHRDLAGQDSPASAARPA